MKPMPFGQVAPGLYIGKRPPSDHRIGLVFDWVVLCAYEYQKRTGEFGRARVLHVPVDDIEDKAPSTHEKTLVIETGRTVAKLVREGNRVLITCYEGRNRSSWVTAIAMLELGMKAPEIIRKIRSVRGPRALSNEYFVEHIRAYTPSRAAA